MSKTTSGVKPTASITGTARQTGSARRQAGKTTSKAGKTTRIRKPLTPAQRKRKQERDRAYRLRKNPKKVSKRLVLRDLPPQMTRGEGHLCGDVPCEQCTEYEKCRHRARTSGFKPLVGMTQAEADFRNEQREKAESTRRRLSLDAREWYDSVVATLKPGESRSRTFSADGYEELVRVERCPDGTLRTTTEKRDPIAKRQESKHDPSMSDEKPVPVPNCGCGSSAEAASNARKWLTEVWSSLRPGERKTQTFVGGGRRIQVEVLRGRPVNGCQESFSRPQAPTVFDGIVNELLDGMFRGPVRCGMDFAGGPMQVVRWLVPPAQALRWQIVSDVRSLVDGRIGWLHDSETWEEMA